MLQMVVPTRNVTHSLHGASWGQGAPFLVRLKKAFHTGGYITRSVSVTYAMGICDYHQIQ